ncbi:MAG: GNAT family N-acetyltransferase [Lachnospiraceae bacterium]|nr:GNAT family N-acetyltransferase [Lachnospiraceae bacterium]
MVSIKEINSTNRNYIKYIAELHKRAFPTFFLTQLGLPFLKTLYKGYLEDEASGIITAEKSEKLIGFIAYSNDYSQFYKGLIKHHLFKFGICSIGAAIRHPSFIKRLLSAFKKSDSVVREEKYVELASICVDPDEESRGIGTSLIDYLKRKVDFNEYSYINLETDAEGNDGVNKFYVKNEFRLTRQFTTAEGRKMNEYRYKEEGL